jgi:hypothetical protein
MPADRPQRNVHHGRRGSPTGAVLIGTFLDANTGATSADFTTLPGTTVVFWGDGSSTALTAANFTASSSTIGVVFSINASHTYAAVGQYAITIDVTDAGGQTTTISSTAFISASALSALASPIQPTVTTTEPAGFPRPVFAPPFTPGTAQSVFTGSNPPSLATEFSATIDWATAPPVGTT